MNIFTGEQLQGCFKKLSKHAGVFNKVVQDALLSCAYYAFKDGNTTPFDQLIAAVGPGVHVKAITRWIELVSGIGRVYKGAIVLNKKVRDMSGVIDLDTFKPFYDDMTQVMWFDAAGKQKMESVFDEGVYLKGVCTKLTKNGWAGLAEAIKQAELQYLVQAAASQRDDAEQQQHELEAEEQRLHDEAQAEANAHLALANQ
jgi:hypothetical protein